MSNVFRRARGRSRRWLLGTMIAGVAGLAAGSAGAAGVARTPSAPVPVVVQKEVRTKATSSTLDDIFKWIQLLAAAAAVGGLVAVGFQLSASRTAARKQRTAEIQERWDHREFRSVMSPVLAYLDVADAGECVEKVRAWEAAPHAEDPCLPRGPSGSAAEGAPRASKNDVLYVISFFEELALLYNHKDVDHELVAESIGPIAVTWLTRSLWFIYYYREVKDSEFFGGEWKKMVAALRAGDPRSRWRRWRSPPHPVYRKLTKMSATPNVRTFYLPRALSDAPDPTWQRGAELSLAHDEGEGQPAVRPQDGWIAVVVDR